MDRSNQLFFVMDKNEWEELSKKVEEIDSFLFGYKGEEGMRKKVIELIEWKEKSQKNTYMMWGGLLLVQVFVLPILISVIIKFIL